MSLSVTEERVGRVLVLSPQGRLDSINSREFHALVMSHIDSGERSVAVNFSNLDYISSAGIRATQIASNATKEAGGQFMLCAMNENISNVFRISGFDRIIAIANTVEDALARFT